MDEKKYAIGIDIGATNTSIGIVNSEGSVIEVQNLMTQSFNRGIDFVNAIVAIGNLYIEKFGRLAIMGIGAGAPNTNFLTGMINENPANLPWQEAVPLRSLLIEKLKLNTVVTNDAKVAAYGEMKFGCATNMKDFIMITLGTGIGSGIVANGQLIYGHDGMAGELGHAIAVKDGRLCGCGRKGCLETYASATGIMKTARQFAASRNVAPFENPRKILFAAQNGDPLALEIFDYTAQILGRSLADAVTYTSPEAFIFFGGLSKAGDYLLQPTKQYFEENLLHIYKNKTKFLISTLQENHAAIVGAAALVF